jgi:DNA-binding NtrC family response regulator
MNKPITEAMILVVDDDALIRDHVAALLVSSGYRVTSVGSSREALELVAAGFAPELLLTDVWIAAGMNGIELAREAQRVLPGLKVLFFSGHINATGREQLPKGAEFLQKPFRRLQCIEKVRSVLTASPALN